MSKTNMQSSKKTPVKVSIRDFKEITSLFFKGEPSFALRLDGAPGIGKSEIIHQIAKENNLHIVETRLAFKDNTELAGYQVPDIENKIAIQLRPEELPSKEGTIWFFDEVNRVYHPSIFQTLFQIISMNRVGTHDLPKRTYIIFAGNLGDEDGTMVTEFDDAALESRYAHFVLVPKYEEWKEYAKTQNFNDTVLAFLDKTVEYWERCNSRTWFQVDKTIKLDPDFMKKYKDSFSPYRSFLAAITSKEVETELYTFIKQYDTVDEMMIIDNYEACKAQVKELPRERLFQLNSKIVLHYETIEKNEKLTKDDIKPDQIKNIVSYSKVLDKDTRIEFMGKLLLSKKFVVKYMELQKEGKISKEAHESIKQAFNTSVG